MSTKRSVFWNRSRFLASTTAAAALTGSLFIATAPLAQADDQPPISQTDETLLESSSESSFDTQNTSGTLPTDAGITMTKEPDQNVGDALGKGYEQNLSVESDGSGGVRAVITEPVQKGGARTTFVAHRGDAAKTPLTFGWPKVGELMVAPVHGQDNITKAHLPANQIVASNGKVFISEYRARWSGSWISEGTTVYQYTSDGTFVNKKDFSVNSAITAMDAITMGTTTYIAVGLNQYGARILDAATMGVARSLYSGWDGSGFYDGDTISSIKLGVGKDGSLLAGIGKFTYRDRALYVADVYKDQTISQHNWRSSTAKWQWPSALSFGTLNGETILAVGWPSEDRVAVVDPYVTDRERFVTKMPEGSLPRALRLFRNAEGTTRLAVMHGFDVDPTMFDPTTMEIQRQVFDVTSNGLVLTKGFPDEPIMQATEFAAEVPGYRSILMNAKNETQQDLRVKFHSSAKPAEGCWFNSELVGGKQFPGQVVVPRTNDSTRQNVTPFFSGGQATAASSVDKDGVCGKWDEVPGVFVVEASLPDGSGRQVAKVTVEATGPRIEPVGATSSEGTQDGDGRFDISLVPAGNGGLLGAWSIVVSEKYAAPTVVSAPTVTGVRLTPKADPGWVDKGGFDDPSRPVYRFTVSDAQWKIPGSDKDLVESTIPAMNAQASEDGVTWDNLGILSPASPPERVANDVVKLGMSTFDWQINPGAPQYRYFRVLNGTGPAVLPSAPVDITDEVNVPVPEAFTEVASIALAPKGMALRANGVSQLPSRYSLKSKAATSYDPTDPVYKPLYDRVYFRDSGTKALLTGLMDPNEPGKTTVVSTIPGSFPNDGSSASVAGVDSRDMFISTTNVLASPPIAVFRASGNTAYTTPPATHPGFMVETTPLSVQGSGSMGVSVVTCGGALCHIGDPTPATPVVFSAGEGKIGLQFRTRAVWSSFPIGAAQPLAGSSFLIRDQRAKLTSADFALQGTFTAVMVANGERIVANQKPVLG